jgi:integrase
VLEEMTGWCGRPLDEVYAAISATAPDGRLFGGVRGGELPTITYRRAWIKTRQMALTAAEQASPLARRPYDLRHACLSTWLNGGVYPTQVAEWAGHSVHVLLRIYAKCIVGQDELAKRRISEAFATGLTQGLATSMILDLGTYGHR